MKKMWILALLIALVLTMCVTARAEEPTWTEVDDAAELTSAIPSSGSAYIKLVGNITLESAITIKSNTTVTLDLNDHTLSAKLAAKRYMIEVSKKASLTVTDSSDDRGGQIKYNPTGLDGYAIVSKGEKLLVENVTVSVSSENNLNIGGINATSGTVTLSGCTINVNAKKGATGVKIDSGVTATVENAVIQVTTSVSTSIYNDNACGINAAGPVTVTGDNTKISATAANVPAYCISASDTLIVNGGIYTATGKTEQAALKLGSSASAELTDANMSDIVNNASSGDGLVINSGTYAGITNKNSGKITINGGNIETVNNTGDNTITINGGNITTITGNNITLKVIFDTAGGSPVAEQNVTHGGKVEEPAKPTKAGHHFVGWYKEAEHTNLWDFTNDTATNGVTLYAKWEKATYSPDAAELDFGEVVYGYTTAPAAQGVTFTTTDSVPTIKSVSESTKFDVSVDGLTVTVTPKSGLGAATHTETIAITTGNDEVANVEVTFTVNKAPLTATYASETIKKGQTPELKVTVTGFVNGETAEVLTATPTLGGDYDVNTVGEYTLTPEGGAADNYVFTYTPGVLKVERRSSGGGTPTPDKKVESPKTFDAGIALYVGMALSSAAGAAYVCRKK